MRNQTDHKNRKHSRIKMFAAVAGIVCILAGCGQDETVLTGADVQTENTEMTDEGTGGMPEDTGSADEAAGGMPEDTASADEGADMKPEDVKSDVSDGDEQASAEDMTLEPSEANASRAQMEIDEETRKELTAELLEENNLDTSVIEPKRSTRGCTFDLPEGFEESEEMAGMYVTGRYPLDASTIYYVAMEQDIALQLLTEETFKEQTQESLRQACGEDVEVTIDNFESIEVSGYPAFRILCHYQVNRIEITQLQYAINADKSYMIIYSQTGDYDRMEEYEASAATIRVQ